MGGLLKPVMIDCPHRLCSHGVELRTSRDCQLCAGKGELPIEFAEKAYFRRVSERETMIGSCARCGRVALVLTVVDRGEDRVLCSRCYTIVTYPDRYEMAPEDAALVTF